MKKTSNIIWGIVLVIAGVVIALNALGITDIDIFFDGWWTLFLIIPGVVGLIRKREKLWSLIITLIGVVFLLSAQNIIPSHLIGQLLFPAIIIIIGARLIFRGMFDSRLENRKMKISSMGGELKSYAAVFSGQNVNLSGEVFEGAELDAIFGGIQLDLREAVIQSDCVIRVSAIFGGVDILLPDNVKADIRSTSLFGGISDKTSGERDDSMPTVYIDGTCMFGGADIK